MRFFLISETFLIDSEGKKYIANVTYNEVFEGRINIVITCIINDVLGEVKARRSSVMTLAVKKKTG